MSAVILAPTAPTIQVGLCLFVPSGPQGEHLFTIICGPKNIASATRPEWLSASICSVKPGVPSDESCVLEVGDHPFLVRQSYVSYSQLRVDFEDDLKQKIASGYFHLTNNASPSLLANMLGGMAVSRRVPRHIRPDWP